MVITKLSIIVDLKLHFDPSAYSSQFQDFVEDPPDSMDPIPVDLPSSLSVTGEITNADGKSTGEINVQLCSDENEIVLPGRIRGGGVFKVLCTCKWSVSTKDGSGPEIAFLPADEG